jgi:hypothetical protein
VITTITSVCNNECTCRFVKMRSAWEVTSAGNGVGALSCPHRGIFSAQTQALCTNNMPPLSKYDYKPNKNYTFLWKSQPAILSVNKSDINYLYSRSNRQKIYCGANFRINTALR